MKFIDLPELRDAVVTILPVWSFDVSLNEVAAVCEVLDLREGVELELLNLLLGWVVHFVIEDGNVFCN